MVGFKYGTKIPKICTVCGKHFEIIILNSNPLRETCSEECHRKLSGIKQKGKISHRKGKTIEEEYGQEKAKEIREKNRSGHLGLIDGKLNPMYGTIRPEDVKEKIRRKLIGRTIPEEVRIKMIEKGKKAWENPNSKLHTKIPGSHELHDFLVEKKVKELKNKGYHCIQLNKRPIPDIIVLKNGIIYAVEIERRWNNRIKRKFYENSGASEYYDSLMWVKFFPESGKTEVSIRPIAKRIS